MSRDRFLIPPNGLTYLDGNSLGRPTYATLAKTLRAVSHDWGDRLIRGWNEGWLDLPFSIGDGIADLIGARHGEVVACDSTSVNLYKLAFAAVEANRPRRRIVTEAGNFPSDLYVLQGLQRVWPDLEIVATDGDPAEALDETTALLCLSHADYRTGRLRDLGALTEAAHRVGALTLWDLSHSAGACLVRFRANGLDMAVGCGYKHLNGGPGAPAYLAVREDLIESLASPIQGWFGQRDAFEFGSEYAPTEGIGRFLAGTPPILGLVALAEGVAVAHKTGIRAIRHRSLQQTERMISWHTKVGSGLGLRLESPHRAEERGAHVLFSHPEAWRINLALIDRGIIGDFRPPDGLRLGPAPLYTTDEEIDRGLSALGEILSKGTWWGFSLKKSRVT
ncbi:kynureninase [soil metagenome]